MSVEHYVCKDCGDHVAVDEDGCCTMCGADAQVAACDCVATRAVTIATLTAERDAAKQSEESAVRIRAQLLAQITASDQALADCHALYGQRVAVLTAERDEARAERQRAGESEGRLRMVLATEECLRDDAVALLREWCDEHEEDGQSKRPIVVISRALLARLAPPAEAKGTEATPVPPDVHERGWQWRPCAPDTAFAPPFGTIRLCRECGCLVAGGPTLCGRCAPPAEKPDNPQRKEP